MISENTVVAEPVAIVAHRHFCWSAVIAGALVGVGLAFLFNLFGFAIGLSAFSLDNDGSIVMAIGGLIGIAIAVFVSMFFGGFAAGYLGRSTCPRGHLGILYGFTTWTLALLLSALATGYMGYYVASYTNSISNSAFMVTDNDGDATTTKVKAAPEVNVNTKPGADAVKVETKPATAPANQQTMVITATPASLAMSAFIVFALFLLGAFASCLGACHAMCCKRHVD